jgi:hypothetical protein
MSAFTRLPFASVAPLLADYGYDPVPIKPGYKAPMLDGWQEPKTPGRYLPKCAAWGTGILTATCPAVDLDIRDRELVRVLIELAGEVLGLSPFRVGAPPKALLPFSTGAPFPKITGRWWALPGDDITTEGYSGHRIEILGAGNQFVAFARHPRGTFYRWRRYSPISTPRDGLPSVDEAEAREFLAAAQRIIQGVGAVHVECRNKVWRRVVEHKHPRRERSREYPPAEWQQMDAETLARAIDNRARRTAGGWKCRCPAHRDASPSFTVTQGDGQAVVHCFTGCAFPDISRAIETLLGRAA